MKLCILHISDLHRDPANPIRNDVLLDSLENDRHHYATGHESESVRSPDLIIASGDIVQGIRPDIEEPEAALRAQYQEALDFLGKLADRFVGGDRNRVIIVPGNHDVSAYHFERSLRRVDILPDRKRELVTQLFAGDSSLRWSWSEFELYEIANRDMYARRMAAFSEFYGQFYGGARTYDLDSAKQVDVFDYPAFGLAIVGFSSCHNNDLLNRQGAIHPACMAIAGQQLRHPNYSDRLRIAVWHHNAEGAPMHTDYMDADLIQNLIDRGFSLGFHGHQHRPQFLDTRFRHGLGRGIAVISAGTLCGGASFGHRRAYNIVELDTTTKTGRLHVREMQNDDLILPIFGRRPLPPTTSPYFDFDFEPPPEPLVHVDAKTAALSKAQRLMDDRDYQGAANVLLPVAGIDALARRLLIGCLVELADHVGMFAVFDPPTTIEEAIHIMDALWAEGRHDRLRDVLALTLIADSSDPSVVELRNKSIGRLKR